MPFCLIGAYGEAERAAVLSGLKSLPFVAPVPGSWQFLQVGTLALALAAPTRLESLHADHEAGSDFPGWAILDGFLSNRDDLIRQLRLPVSRCTSDPQLMAEAIRHIGCKALQYLQGNYAICIVEPDGAVVHAARDRLGGRTLYHASSPRCLAVASRSACIAALPQFGGQEDAGFVVRRMALRFPPEPGRTAFAGIYELRGGEIRRWQDGRVTSERRPFRFESHGDFRDSADAVEAFSEAFEQAVAGTLGDHGNVAIMLSGGMDSGPAAAVANDRLVARGDALYPVSWVLPDDPRADEERWIRLLCDSIDRPLKAIVGGPDSAFDELGGLAVSPDLPSFNPYRGLINACYRTAAELGCSVMLNGNAGDQLYPPADLRLIDLLHRRRYRAASALVLSRLVRSRIYRAHRDRLLRGTARRYLSGFGLQRAHRSLPEWLTPWALQHILEPEQWPPEAEEYPFPDYARQLIGAGMAFGRAHEMVWSERFGVERRDPFHNEDLVRLMLRMPVELSYRNGMDKWLMREAMADRMPEPLRLKRRTGRLGSLFDSGWQANRNAVRRLLFERHTGWQRFVRSDYVGQALQGRQAPGRGPMMVVAQCIGHALWQGFWENQERRGGVR